MESEFPALDPATDFPPLTPDWSPPPSYLPLWGPPPKLEDYAWSDGPYRGKTEEQCYRAISKYLLTEQQREDNGYPHFPNGRKTMAIIKRTKYYDSNPVFVGLGTRQRTCCRCNERFVLGPPPHFQNPMATCLSHLRPTYDPQRRAVLHPCCHASPEHVRSNSGCFSRNFHVFHHIFESELFKFVQCPESTGPDDFRLTGVYALDCEMVYTSHGPALARLSLVDIFGTVLMDVLVKPEGEVYDANTTFSGLTIRDVQLAQETLESCREKLFEFVSRDSILIGHSLEADLKALRLVHENIVDTSVLFMEKKRKKGLRLLASQLLNRHIQQTKGHDSTEDARTCTELVALRLDEDDAERKRDANFNNL